MSLARKVLHSSGVNLLDHGVKFAAIFLLTPIMIDRLGEESYGTWFLIVSVVTYFHLLDMGITVSGTHFAAGSIGKNDRSQLLVWLGTARRLYRRMTVGTLVLTPVAAAVLAIYFSTPENRTTIAVVTGLCGLAVALRFFWKAYQVLIKAHVRYDLIVWPSIARVTIQSVAIWIALENGAGLLGVGIIMAVSDLAESTTIALLGRSLLLTPETAPSKWTVASKEDGTRLLKHSGASFLTSVGQNLRSRVDPLIVARFVSVGHVTVYGVGARFLIFFEDIVNALLGGQFLSAFSQIANRDGKEKLNDIFLDATRIAVAISVLGAGAMLVFGDAFISRWVGEKLQTPGAIDDAVAVLMILAAPYALRLAAYPAGNLLYSLGKHHHLAAINFGGGLFNIVLSIILAYKFGFFGVVYATAAELVLVGLFVLPMVVAKASGISLVSYLGRLLGWMVLCAVPVAAFAWATQSLIAPDYLRLTLLGGGLTAVFALWCWFLLLGKTHRAAALALRRR